jgi:hypothetical protein
VTVSTVDGIFTGLFCSTTSGTATIKIWDNTAASTAVLLDTFTPVAATKYNFENVLFSTGLLVNITGVMTATLFYK